MRCIFDTEIRKLCRQFVVLLCQYCWTFRSVNRSTRVSRLLFCPHASWWDIFPPVPRVAYHLHAVVYSVPFGISKTTERSSPLQWHRNEFESGVRWEYTSAPENIYLSCPSTFFDSVSTISRFGERFRDGQYSLVSFLFVVLLTVPPVPSHL